MFRQILIAGLTFVLATNVAEEARYHLRPEESHRYFVEVVGDDTHVIKEYKERTREGLSIVGYELLIDERSDGDVDVFRDSRVGVFYVSGDSQMGPVAHGEYVIRDTNGNIITEGKRGDGGPVFTAEGEVLLGMTRLEQEAFNEKLEEFLTN